MNSYPNPFDKQISISNPEFVEKVIITNILGQRVIDAILNGSNTLITDGLNPGIYLITLQGFNGERTVRKMMKN